MKEQEPLQEDLKKSKTEKKTVIIIKENLHESILADLFTFFCIVLLVALNHVLFGGSWPLDLFAILSVVFFVVNYNSVEKEMTVDEALNYLTEIKKHERTG